MNNVGPGLKILHQFADPDPVQVHGFEPWGSGALWPPGFSGEAQGVAPPLGPVGGDTVVVPQFLVCHGSGKFGQVLWDLHPPAILPVQWTIPAIWAALLQVAVQADGDQLRRVRPLRAARWAGLLIPGTGPALERVFAAYGHQPPFCASATRSGGRCSVCPLGLDWRHSSPSRKHGRGGASPGSQDPERDAEPG